MLASSKIEPSEKRMRTRRNVIALGAILGGALLSGCKQEVETFENMHHLRLSNSPNCFVRGTHILTPEGARRIEDLRIGDSISTLDGGEESVRWIGRRRYCRTLNEDWKTEIKPVRIAQGALQEGAPTTDLLVSQDHRLYLDGVLIRAGDLVNGYSISLDSCVGLTEIEYMHVMTEQHTILLSEGAPSETLFAELQNLSRFDNFVDYQTRYGNSLGHTQMLCAPVHRDLGCSARIQSHIRSALSPWIDRRNQFDKARDNWMSSKLSR